MMPAPSDDRMAKLKAAINESRDGDLAALLDCHVTASELIAVSAVAKASGDQYMYSMVEALLDAMFNRTLP
jgi:hypothetical protein